jgi:BASS family bile acid:Na+ symporter
VTESLLVAVKLSVVVLIFAIGLGSTPADLTYLWRRPALLARSLLAMYVAVPVVVLALAAILPLTPPVRTAVVVLAISAGAPLLPKKLMKLGREGYVFSLVVTSSLVAIVAVPLWVTAIGALVRKEPDIDALIIARLIARAFLGPLLLGMFLRWPLSPVAEQIADWLLKAMGAVLAVAGLSLLALNLGLLVKAGWVPLTALLGMTVVALVVGHLCGGPDPDDRTALAVCCATRHVGISMLAAAAVPGPRTAALMVAYVIAAAITSALCLRWRAGASGGTVRRRMAGDEAGRLRAGDEAPSAGR